MAAMVKFIANIALWLYLGLLVIGLILLRAIQIAAKERSQSIFGLERDRATAILNRNLFYLLLIFLVGIGVFYISTELIKQVPLPEETPTPTTIARLPDTPTPPILLPTPTQTLTPSPRPTPFGEIVETPTSAQNQPGTTPNCPIPGVRISQPGNGAIVSGQIQIFGTANIDNFDYYKIEFRIPGQNWNFIESFTNPVGDGRLANWNTATVPPGSYDFRLVVVDKTGNFPEPCQIRLTVR